MNTKLSISIMAHHSRAEWVKEIKTKMNEDIHTEWDRGISLWDTARRAWLSYDPAATHHLVLQDDIIPSKNLRKTLEKAIQYSGDKAICLFIFQEFFKEKQKNKYDMAYNGGIPWLRVYKTVLAPAVIIPTKYIKEFVEFGDKRKDIKADDTKMTAFFDRKNIPVLLTVPSLVQHIDGKSLVGLSTKDRTAYKFIGEENSGEDLAWDSKPII